MQRIADSCKEEEAEFPTFEKTGRSLTTVVKLKKINPLKR
jgi:hypothetical protein